jgi:hypothetical protein
MKESIDTMAVMLKSQMTYDPITVEVAKDQVLNEYGFLEQEPTDRSFNVTQLPKVVKRLRDVVECNFEAENLELARNMLSSLGRELPGKNGTWLQSNYYSKELWVNFVKTIDTLKNCRGETVDVSLFPIGKGQQLIRFLVLYPIYLFLLDGEGDDLEHLNQGFYSQDIPSNVNTLRYKLNIITSGIFQNLECRQTISNTTNKELYQFVNQQRFERDERNKKRVQDLDKEARDTYNIYRMFNLGKSHSSHTTGTIPSNDSPETVYMNGSHTSATEATQHLTDPIEYSQQLTDRGIEDENEDLELHLGEEEDDGL